MAPEKRQSQGTGNVARTEIADTSVAKKPRIDSQGRLPSHFFDSSATTAAAAAKSSANPSPVTSSLLNRYQQSALNDGTGDSRGSAKIAQAHSQVLHEAVSDHEWKKFEQAVGEKLDVSDGVKGVPKRIDESAIASGGRGEDEENEAERKDGSAELSRELIESEFERQHELEQRVIWLRERIKARSDPEAEAEIDGSTEQVTRKEATNSRSLTVAPNEMGSDEFKDTSVTRLWQKSDEQRTQHSANLFLDRERNKVDAEDGDNQLLSDEEDWNKFFA